MVFTLKQNSLTILLPAGRCYSIGPVPLLHFDVFETLISELLTDYMSEDRRVGEVLRKPKNWEIIQKIIDLHPRLDVPSQTRTFGFPVDELKELSIVEMKDFCFGDYQNQEKEIQEDGQTKVVTVTNFTENYILTLNGISPKKALWRAWDQVCRNLEAELNQAETA